MFIVYRVPLNQHIPVPAIEGIFKKEPNAIKLAKYLKIKYPEDKPVISTIPSDLDD